MPPTTAELVHDRSLGDLLIHRDVVLDGLDAPQRAARTVLADIHPAPRRTGPTWRAFLSEQATSLIACDVLHIDTIGLQRLYALIFLEHHTR
ncbi:hypothetical protein ACWGLG_47350, partial [Streptomyces antimycoticus]